MTSNISVDLIVEMVRDLERLGEGAFRVRDSFMGTVWEIFGVLLMRGVH